MPDLGMDSGPARRWARRIAKAAAAAVLLMALVGVGLGLGTATVLGLLLVCLGELLEDT